MTAKKLIDKLFIKNSQREDLYLKREVLIHSFEKRNMDLLTITGSNGISESRESLIAGLFPNESVKRPYRFPNKKYVVISSRVHPGEVAASHMMNGFLFSLLGDPSKNFKLQLALNHFVFLVIPILNPDGVYRGHYRMDTHGNNLNRCYDDPDPNTQPTIYAVDKLIECTYS